MHHYDQMLMSLAGLELDIDFLLTMSPFNCSKKVTHMERMAAKFPMRSISGQRIIYVNAKQYYRMLVRRIKKMSSQKIVRQRVK